MGSFVMPDLCKSLPSTVAPPISSSKLLIAMARRIVGALGCSRRTPCPKRYLDCHLKVAVQVTFQGSGGGSGRRCCARQQLRARESFPRWCHPASPRPGDSSTSRQEGSPPYSIQPDCWCSACGRCGCSRWLTGVLRSRSCCRCRRRCSGGGSDGGGCGTSKMRHPLVEQLAQSQLAAAPRIGAQRDRWQS